MNKQKDSNFTYEIKKIIGSLSENNTMGWKKVLSLISWNNSAPQLDIRNISNYRKIDNEESNKIQDLINDNNIRFGKGITITDEEANMLVDLLLTEGYGTIKALEEAIKIKKSRFTKNENLNNISDDTPPFDVD